MSWSMIEPEEPAVCECKYDEARDEIDRGDCPFHYDLVEDSLQPDAHPVRRRTPASAVANQQEDAG